MSAAAWTSRISVWPPADALLGVAERLRACLGPANPPASAWRLCLTAPPQPGLGDILLPGDAPRTPAAREQARRDGALVLEADPERVTLYTAQAALQAAPHSEAVPGGAPLPGVCWGAAPSPSARSEAARSQPAVAAPVSMPSAARPVARADSLAHSLAGSIVNGHAFAPTRPVTSPPSACYALATRAGERSDDWLAAFAAFLDCDFAPHDALCLALAWRTGDEARADPWPAELTRFPRVLGLPTPPSLAFNACPTRLGLYPVVPDATWIERLLALGVRTLQWRNKSQDPAILLPEVIWAVAVSRRARARLFINDHWHLALDAGAYGVHLGYEDVLALPGGVLQTLATAGLRMGLSTHGYYEILAALHFRPSYLALGSVFPTATKLVTTAPQGLTKLARYVRLLDGVLPTVAIGGIDLAKLPGVLATGVGGAALARALTETADVPGAVAALQQQFGA